MICQRDDLISLCIGSIIQMYFMRNEACVSDTIHTMEVGMSRQSIWFHMKRWHSGRGGYNGPVGDWKEIVVLHEATYEHPKERMEEDYSHEEVTQVVEEQRLPTSISEQPETVIAESTSSNSHKEEHALA